MIKQTKMELKQSSFLTKLLVNTCLTKEFLKKCTKLKICLCKKTGCHTLNDLIKACNRNIFFKENVLVVINYKSRGTLTELLPSHPVGTETR